METSADSNVLKAACVYLLLWLPALLVASFLSFMGYVGMGFGLRIAALVFLATLPVALLGLWSFRASALAYFALFLCDLLTSAWPHVSIASYFQSKMGTALLASMLLTLLVWGMSPFASFIAFVRRVRDSY
jgi:hypothetical protein